MTRTWVAAAGLLLALGTGGCGGTPDGSSAASSAEPEWPPPELVVLPEPVHPGVTEGPATRADARRYAAFLGESMDWMLRTSFNAKVLRNHRCTVCTDLVALADAARAQHLVHEFDEVSVDIVEAYPAYPLEEGDPSTYWGFVVEVDLPEVRVLDDRGREVDVVPGETLETDLMLGEYDGVWWVDYWRPLDIDAA